jgi:hypothetical protein
MISPPILLASSEAILKVLAALSTSVRLIQQGDVRVLPMMVNTHIIHSCTSLKIKFPTGSLSQTPGGGASHHHVTYILKCPT